MVQMKKDAPKHQNKCLIIKSKLRKQTFNKTVEEFLMELVIGEEDTGRLRTADWQCLKQ